MLIIVFSSLSLVPARNGINYANNGVAFIAMATHDVICALIRFNVHSNVFVPSYVGRFKKNMLKMVTSSSDFVSCHKILDSSPTEKFDAVEFGLHHIIHKKLVSQL